MSLEGAVERAAADRVPPPVSEVLTAHYAPGELARVYRALEDVHRRRRALAAFREARRRGQNAEQAIAEAAEEVERSVTWVRETVYGRAA